MSKIDIYRKLMGVDDKAGLKDLKTIYRDFMKEWHPDKFQDNHEDASKAEEKSKAFIEAYHFLVSIAPETRENNRAEYTETITSGSIVDYSYKAQTLQISFSDGASYEYFDVPKNIYVKLINADSPGRFARRHICSSYIYRNISKLVSAN